MARKLPSTQAPNEFFSSLLVTRSRHRRAGRNEIGHDQLRIGRPVVRKNLERDVMAADIEDLKLEIFVQREEIELGTAFLQPRHLGLGLAGGVDEVGQCRELFKLEDPLEIAWVVADELLLLEKMACQGL